MNKARKQPHKRGFFKRLVQESGLLSCTRFLSARLVHFFEYGFASPLLKYGKRVDGIIREKITDPLFEKIGFRQNFSIPVRSAVASFFERNPIIKTLNALRLAFLSLSMRTMGVFTLTFGIYTAAIFLLKSYIDVSFGSEAGISDISVAAVSIIVGLLFTLFGDKSILHTVGTSRIVGSLLENRLGVNEAYFDITRREKTTTSVAIAFLLGSVFGISTLFLPTVKLIGFAVAFLLALTIMCITEFGFMLSVVTCTFLPVEYSFFICIASIASYLLKCLRLKRSMRFGTADTVMLLALLALIITCSVSGVGTARGELYLICFTAIYFLAKNLLISKALVVQTFNALCIGTGIGIALYILGDYATLIPHEHFRSLALLLSANAIEPELLAMIISVTVPFALTSRADGNAKNYLLLCAVAAVLIDSTLFYVIIAVSVLVYIFITYKAPVGTFFASLIILPPLVVFARDYTYSKTVVFGAKTMSHVALSDEIQTTGFWSGVIEVGSVATLILLVIAIVLILQRLLGERIACTDVNYVKYSGAATSSAVNMLICSFLFNAFSDLRIYSVIFVVLGLCGAIYRLMTVPVSYSTEV